MPSLNWEDARRRDLVGKNPVEQKPARRRMPKKPTTKQVLFIIKLYAELGLEFTGEPDTRWQASRLIDDLLRAKGKKRGKSEAKKSARTRHAPIPYRPDGHTVTNLPPAARCHVCHGSATMLVWRDGVPHSTCDRHR